MEGVLRIVSVLSADESEDSLRLVVLLAILIPNGDLSIKELTSSFACSECWEVHLVILVACLSMSKNNACWLSATSDAEVN